MSNKYYVSFNGDEVNYEITESSSPTGRSGRFSFDSREDALTNLLQSIKTDIQKLNRKLDELNTLERQLLDEIKEEKRWWNYQTSKRS